MPETLMLLEDCFLWIQRAPEADGLQHLPQKLARENIQSKYVILHSIENHCTSLHSFRIKSLRRSKASSQQQRKLWTFQVLTVCYFTCI